MKLARSRLGCFLILICVIAGGCSAGGDLKDAEAYKQRARANSLKYDQLVKETPKTSGATRSSWGTNEYYREISAKKKDLLDNIIADLSQALKLDPADTQTYYARGLAYYRRGYYDSAIADNTSAIHLNPGYSQAYCNRGAAYAKKNQLDQALTDYEQTLKIDPIDYIAIYNKALALEKLGRKKEALEIYYLILQKAPLEFEAEIADAQIRSRQLETNLKSLENIR